MPRKQAFLCGLLSGLLLAALLLALVLSFLPRMLIVNHQPISADAVIILGGDIDGARLRRGAELLDQGWAMKIILTSAKKESWQKLAQDNCPGCRLAEREVIYLDGSVDTSTEAQISLDYCQNHHLKKVLIVTSPYHTRRTQLVFNDFFEGSGVEPIVIAVEEYSKLVPPVDQWWADRRTLETIWLEFGKILYWELTPFTEYRGENTKLKVRERLR